MHEVPQQLESFVEILGHLREPLLLASRDGRIWAANVAGAEALGTSVAGLDGATLASFSRDPAALTEALGLAPSRRSFPLSARDGRRFLCDARALGHDLLLLRLSGGPDAEPRARVFAEVLSRLSGITALDGRALEEVSRAILEQGVRAIGALAGGLFLVDDAGANLELKVSVNYPEDLGIRYRMIPLSANLPIVDTVKKQESNFLGTLEDYTQRYPDFAAARPEIAQNGFASLPLVVDGGCVGALVIGFASPFHFTSADRELLSSLAAECAKAIVLAQRLDTDRASLELAQRATGRLERLHAFTGALAQALTPPEVVEAIVEMGMAATSAKSGGLWLSSKDEKSLCLARGVGPTGPRAEDYQNVPLDRPSRMPILDAVRDGAPVWLETCGQLEERYPDVYRAMSSRAGDFSLACIPMFAQGRCIGGLALAFDGAHPFLEDERAFLHVLTWYSAQAIERARLYAAETLAKEAAEANRKRSDFLADIGTLLASPLGYADMLAAVTQAVVPRVAGWCVIELADERLQGIPPVAAHVDPAKIPLVLEMHQLFRNIGRFESGIAAVIRSGKSQLHSFTPADLMARFAANPNLSANPRLPELAMAVGVGSSMVVPVCARGVVIGAIVLSRLAGDPRYDEHDLAMAEELGRRLGLALDNARLYREVREDDRLKDEFLAMLSHELRNPLAPIVSALDVMKARGDDTFTRERALISRHVQHIVRLVDDLLDVSRVTRGKVQLTKERCEVADVVSAAVEMTTPLLTARGHHLLVAVADQLPVHADRARLAQALSNLLVNAAKYTEPGGKIAVEAHADGHDVVLAVRDSGMGIAPGQIPRIFELFVQASDALDRGQAGLGIGLTVARSLVNLHGGSISAYSAGPGSGSEFTIRLPLAAAEAIASVAARAPSERTPAQVRWRVLVVNDNHDAAEMLGMALEALDCTARVFNDAPSALAAVAEFQPDLGLLDIGLPGMDGYELARRLRQTEIGRSMRLVAVTGYGQPSDRQRSRDAGFDEHLVKPVSVATLQTLIQRFQSGTSD